MIPCLWIIPKGSKFAKEWIVQLLFDWKRKTIWYLVIAYISILPIWLNQQGKLESVRHEVTQGQVTLFSIVLGVLFYLLSTAYDYGVFRHKQVQNGYIYIDL